MPYLEFKPGDKDSAQRLNEMQEKIMQDIRDQIDAAKQDMGCPERYFLDLEVLLAGPPQILQPAVLVHDLGCHPIVQVYELQDLPIASQEYTREYKFAVCGPAHANDPEAIDFKTRSWDERHWGDDINLMISQLADPDQRQAKFRDSFTLDVWIVNLEELLFEPGPSQYHFDRGDVYRTQWVRDREGRTISELKDRGEWPPLFVYRPRLVNHILPMEGGEESSSKAKKNDWVRIGIYHLNLNEVEIAPEVDEEMHLMVLLHT